ncbi:unnamed protein product [Cylindrotheca closterium]|uniref:Uncharacterized protein n=1 Tax=Cylindrotheca closterium TaxID=2856 RepID=A0AAD2CVC2_9STRA|nr:unnamed protein product [Cylindrotheca closterium]
MVFKSGVIGALGIASHVKVIHREDGHAEMSPPRSDSNCQIILEDFSGLLTINLVVIADTDDAVATMTTIERPTLDESEDKVSIVGRNVDSEPAMSDNQLRSCNESLNALATSGVY